MSGTLRQFEMLELPAEVRLLSYSYILPNTICLEVDCKSEPFEPTSAAITKFLNNEKSTLIKKRVSMKGAFFAEGFGYQSPRSRDRATVIARAMSSLTQTCRTIRQEVTPLLYSRIALRTRDVYAVFILAAKSPAVSFVETLDVGMPEVSAARSSRRTGHQDDLVKVLPNLKSLYLRNFTDLGRYGNSTSARGHAGRIEEMLSIAGHLTKIWVSTGRSNSLRLTDDNHVPRAGCLYEVEIVLRPEHGVWRAIEV